MLNRRSLLKTGALAVGAAAFDLDLLAAPVARTQLGFLELDLGLDRRRLFRGRLFRWRLLRGCLGRQPGGQRERAQPRAGRTMEAPAAHQKFFSHRASTA